MLCSVKIDYESRTTVMIQCYSQYIFGNYALPRPFSFRTGSRREVERRLQRVFGIEYNGSDDMIV